MLCEKWERAVTNGKDNELQEVTEDRRDILNRLVTCYEEISAHGCEHSFREQELLEM